MARTRLQGVRPLVILATPPLVILSEAKDLTRRAEMLREVYTECNECVQDDIGEIRMTSGWSIRLSSPDALMVQEVGINVHYCARLGNRSFATASKSKTERVKCIN